MGCDGTLWDVPTSTAPPALRSGLITWQQIFLTPLQLGEPEGHNVALIWSPNKMCFCSLARHQLPSGVGRDYLLAKGLPQPGGVCPLP